MRFSLFIWCDLLTIRFDQFWISDLLEETFEFVRIVSAIRSDSVSRDSTRSSSLKKILLEYTFFVLQDRCLDLKRKENWNFFRFTNLFRRLKQILKELFNEKQFYSKFEIIHTIITIIVPKKYTVECTFLEWLALWEYQFSYFDFIVTFKWENL